MAIAANCSSKCKRERPPPPKGRGPKIRPDEHIGWCSTCFTLVYYNDKYRCFCCNIRVRIKSKKWKWVKQYRERRKKRDQPKDAVSQVQTVAFKNAKKSRMGSK